MATVNLLTYSASCTCGKATFRFIFGELQIIIGARAPKVCKSLTNLVFSQCIRFVLNSVPQKPSTCQIPAILPTESSLQPRRIYLCIFSLCYVPLMYTTWSMKIAAQLYYSALFRTHFGLSASLSYTFTNACKRLAKAKFFLINNQAHSHSRSHSHAPLCTIRSFANSRLINRRGVSLVVHSALHTNLSCEVLPINCNLFHQVMRRCVRSALVWAFHNSTALALYAP